MKSTTILATVLAASVMSVGLSGCSQYVKKTDFNAAISQLQQKDAQLQQQIDSVKQEMASQFSKYDAKITAMQGRVSVDTVAHFGFNEATLRDQDKPALANFAQTIEKYHPGVMTTVEGFTDPAGLRAYNKKLGQQRADAVRDFLVSSGLSADQVRAVSYGESHNRQVTPGATHAKGADNRRTSLAVDFAGHGAVTQIAS